ncbi:MAG TPA: maleylpyruvate isomerase family mycothiol-dependent enzyme [Acidimicrobiia bacterium]
MDAVVGALAEQHAELAGLLTDLGEADWHRPSPCEGWDVADVVLHLAQSDDLARASAQGRFAEVVEELAAGLGPAGSVDDGAALMVERERGRPGTAVRDRWQESAGELRRVLGTTDPHARLVWVAGELSARTLATTRLAECWIHTGDVAAAFGVGLPATDRLWHVARLAWRTLPYAYARADRGPLAGPVAFVLQAPSGDEWRFAPDAEPVTTITGDAAELCLVAARRVDPASTGLRGDGADADTVLELVRTYA